MGKELLILAKTAGSFLIDNYPDLLKDSEGEIQQQLDELDGVLSDPASGAIECTISVLKTLLIMTKVAGEKVFDKIMGFGEDVYDYFTGEDSDEVTPSGTTTTASSKRATTGTRANTERIQKLLNQYWTKEGLTSPDVALEEDGKWGDLTDYMWFAVWSTLVILIHGIRQQPRQ